MSLHPKLDSSTAPTTEPTASGATTVIDAGSTTEPATASSPPPDAGAEPAPEPRGRIRLLNGAPVTDTGSPLRGVTLGADFGFDFELQSAPELAAPLVARLFQRLSHELGLNAIHVYLENWAMTPGEAQALADVLVEETARAGMYLLLGIGTGLSGDGHGGLGYFDPDFVRAFFTRYAARYGSFSHVLFEIQNVPDVVCDAQWSVASLDLERNTYALIRELAPDSHIILHSYSATPTAVAFNANVAQLAAAVAWDNVSVGFHATDDCVPIAEINNYGPTANGEVVALLATELPVASWQANLVALEASAVGWFSYRWLTTSESLDSFRNEHELAGIRWCPDFGTWPMDSATCGAVP